MARGCLAEAASRRQQQKKTENIRNRSGVLESLNLPEDKRSSDDELFQIQEEYLERLSTFDTCPSLSKKNQFCKCKCLTILRVRVAVAAYVLDFQKMDLVDRLQRVVEWYKFVRRERNPKFVLPCNITDVVMSADSERRMSTATICTSALGQPFRDWTGCFDKV